MATYPEGALSLPRAGPSGARPQGPTLSPRAPAPPADNAAARGQEDAQSDAASGGKRQQSTRDRLSALAGRAKEEQSQRAASGAGGTAAIAAAAQNPVREAINYGSDLLMIFLFTGVLIPILDQIMFMLGILWFGIRVVFGNIMGVESIAIRGLRSLYRNIGSITAFLWGFLKALIVTGILVTTTQCMARPADCLIEAFKQIFS